MRAHVQCVRGWICIGKSGIRVTETSSSLVAPVCSSVLDLEGIHPLTSFFFTFDESLFSAILAIRPLGQEPKYQEFC